ncbi:MAG TPA: DMT family transporter [Isosphaeraceae bacterium]|nr:DMT family transporter [Isosphaeraceae bacterium]
MSELQPKTRLDPAGVLGMVFCCLLWGGNAVAVKFSVPAIPPFGCAGLRFALALPFFAWFCKRSGQPLFPPRSLWWLLVINTAFTLLQIGSFQWGTGLSQAGRASVFINVHPLVVAPLAWLVLGEHMGVRGVLGLLAAAGGVMVLLGRSFEAAGPIHSPSEMLGDSIVLLSGITFGVQTIAQKLTFPRIPPLTLLFSQTALAMPVFFGMSAVLEGFSNYHFTVESVGGLLFQGLFASALCFSLWLTLLRVYPAGRLATLAFLAPFFGVGLSVLLKGEPLTLSLAVGGALVGLGIWLVASARADRPASRVVAEPLLGTTR